MKSSYWQERFLQEEEKRNKDARVYLSSIEKQYDMALRDIEKNINDWYVRIAKNNEIGLREAKILLSKNELKEFHWTLEDYIEKGKENAVSQEWIKELENASAKTHISKLEALKVQIQNEIEGLYGERLKGMENYLERVYKDNYYRTAFTIQKGLEIGWSLAILDTNKINQIIHKPWAIDGKNFSERIWEDKTKLINTLHTGLTQNIIRGFAPDNLIKQISKEFGVKKSIAGRLVMTESAAYSSKAQEKCFKDLGVEKYEIVATLDTSTSAICREMDGKIFDMKDYQVGITANPFHPNCRTVTAPYFEDDTNSMRAMRTEEGKTEYVPANMKYEEWYKKYVMKEPVKSGIIEERKYKVFENKDKWIEFIKDEENNFLNSITRKEKSKIYDYTCSYASVVNAGLRGEFKLTEEDFENINIIRNAMKKFELKENIVTYRAVDITSVFGKSFNLDEIDTLIGKEYCDLGFMSSTPIFETVKTYASIWRKNAVFEIQLNAGKEKCAYIEKLSRFGKKENELLLKDGSKFKIIGIDKKDNYPLIRMVELND